MVRSNPVDSKELCEEAGGNLERSIYDKVVTGSKDFQVGGGSEEVGSS